MAGLPPALQGGACGHWEARIVYILAELGGGRPWGPSSCPAHTPPTPRSRPAVTLPAGSVGPRLHHPSSPVSAARQVLYGRMLEPQVLGTEPLTCPHHPRVPACLGPPHPAASQWGCHRPSSASGTAALRIGPSWHRQRRRTPPLWTRAVLVGVSGPAGDPALQTLVSRLQLPPAARQLPVRPQGGSIHCAAKSEKLMKGDFIVGSLPLLSNWKACPVEPGGAEPCLS